jgi:hypothetical protein
MRFEVHHYHHHSESLKGSIMAVSAAVQSLLDQVKANTSLEQSADLALKALAKQISDLGTQISALQAQVAAGAALGADDLAALSTAQKDLATSATTLQVDVPANVPPATPAP